MPKSSVAYAFIKEPNGNQIVIVGVGKKFHKIDEDGCTELEIVKHGDISLPVEFLKIDNRKR